MAERHFWKLAVATVAWLACSPSSAQVLGIGRGLLPNPLPPIQNTLRNTTGTLDHTLNAAVDTTAAVVRDTVGRPRTAPGRLIENDINGAHVVRGEVLCLSPTDDDLSAARKLEFEITRRETLAPLGLSMIVLRAPEGISATEALNALRKADPTGTFDYNHIYEPSGASGGATAPAEAASESGIARIGMIDGGIERNHRAFHNATIEEKTFSGKGPGPATEHGTAVASLLIGQDRDFHGVLPGSTLFAADVYGGVPTGGSADDIARALAWLASENVPVTNISLAGPPNIVLAAATAAFVKSGHVLIAAVGNDGPAAPSRYPAAYPGVVGVTSVDSRLAIQIDANRGSDVAFAARGVDVRAAALHGHYANVTGTSFASPIVAARFAQLVKRPDPATVSQAWAILEKAALDLGSPGRDPVFGYGYLEETGQASALASSEAHQ